MLNKFHSLKVSLILLAFFVFINNLIAENYPNMKYGRTKCKQDIGFLLDAVAYDLTFGGNWQSVIAGNAYYTGTQLNIPADTKAATLAAYGFLKQLVQTVQRNITVTPLLQTDVAQIAGTNYTVDSNGANIVFSSGDAPLAADTIHIIEQPI